MPTVISLDHFSGVELAKPEGTYMLYLDCEKFCQEHDMSMDELIRAGIRVGVIWQDGRLFPQTLCHPPESGASSFSGCGSHGTSG